MHMPEGDPHPSTLPGFRGTRDPERSVTRSWFGRKKRRVEFEDVQPQDIPNPTEDNFLRRCTTQLPDVVSHIYYTGNELTLIGRMNYYCSYFYSLHDGKFVVPNDQRHHPRYLAAVNDLDSAAQYGWGSAILASLYHGLDTAVTTEGAITGFVQLLPVTSEVRILLDPPLSMSLHISSAALHEMKQTGFIDCEQFVVGEERETYASYWAEQTSEVGHMLIDSQRMGNLDMFRPSALRAGITPVVVTSASVHSLSQDFSLPGEMEGPELGWHGVDRAV
ncbi:hypothetical protein GIB67_036973 [Kingdonia uniflora]|uniref:Uncharacterized protein n=1 Tax=Kingdonia uniflora TaxID=39325 RepID=A0A7J7NVS5_9MAGN|nr:hypothetical protein GIB67_036973 [Kingdonia uniflora]